MIPLADVQKHFTDFFAGHSHTEALFEEGPILSLAPQAKVLVFGPGPRCPHHVYATVGASSVRPGSHVEFLLCAVGMHPRLVEHMTMVIHYHHTQGLDVGHTFPIGRPWLPTAFADHMLVALPYPFDPSVSVRRIQGHELRVLWLMPVFKSEVSLRHSKGLEALESLFESRGVEYLDPRRTAVA